MKLIAVEPGLDFICTVIKPGLNAETSLAQKKMLLVTYPPQGKLSPLSSVVLLLLLAQSLATIFQSLGHCVVSIFFFLSQAQKE